MSALLSYPAFLWSFVAVCSWLFPALGWDDDGNVVCQTGSLCAQFQSPARECYH